MTTESDTEKNTTLTINRSAPIGIFDSGLGGLSILRAILKILPNESLIYFADSLYAPYGERSEEFIIARSLKIAKWLVKHDVKALVVACNTATAYAINPLRAYFNALPIIGVEPGIKPATVVSRNHKIGVLATQATLRSERFLQLLAQYNADYQFICQAGHGLVNLIEQGDTHSAQLIHLLSLHLDPIIRAQADTLVLGSTHFPFLHEAIQKIVHTALISPLNLIEPSCAVAIQLNNQLQQCALSTEKISAKRQKVALCSTAHTSYLQTLTEQLLNIKSEVQIVPL